MSCSRRKGNAAAAEVEAEGAAAAAGSAGLLPGGAGRAAAGRQAQAARRKGPGVAIPWRISMSLQAMKKRTCCCWVAGMGQEQPALPCNRASWNGSGPAEINMQELCSYV